MKKIIVTYILCLMFLQAFTQSNIRLNNYWGNPININPSAIYDKYLAVFSMAAHKQWMGIEGAPVTYYFTASTYLEDDHTQFGLHLFQDKVGYTNTTNIGLKYGYAIPLELDWQLHLGLGFNYQRTNYDLSKVNLDINTDNFVFQNLISVNNYNADVGMEITNKALRMGIASQNLLSAFDKASNKIQTNTNFAYAKYRYFSNDIVNYGLGVSAIQYTDILQMEFNFMTYFKYSNHSGLTIQPDLFDIGLYYRTKSELGLIIGFELTKAFHVSYSYDYHLGGIRHGSYGTNEIVLTYNLSRKEVCHNCWY